MKRLLAFAALSVALLAPAARAEVIVAEGESFAPQGGKGWKLTPQDDTHGSHTYGGMWMTHGACLGAPADAAGAIATRTINVTDGGKYRVWSKYQAPPYFNYLHKVEVVQGGKVVFSHVYGKRGADRFWSFSARSDELWWPWGVDHDAAEAPAAAAELRPGAAELRLTAVANAAPAGDRFVDFVLLTTDLKDNYKGFQPYAVGSPFANEALDASRLYLRFRNTAATPARLTVVRPVGHFQPQYGGATVELPHGPDPKAKEQPKVPPGQWSAWINVGPFCRLVHDEGLTLTLPGAAEVQAQFARDEAGKDLVGDVIVKSGEAVVVPLEVTWKKDARVLPSREHARRVLTASKSWRKANGGKRPKEILYYGAFAGDEDWVHELKAALGYNTQLPAKYEPVKRSGLHAHAHNPKEIEAFAKTLKDRDNFLVLSLGDEISLGAIDYKDPTMQTKFRAWLKGKGVTKDELGTAPEQAVLTPQGNPRLAWFTQQFNEEERFAAYRDMTALAKRLIGPHVLTGANFSPHHGTLYYGPIYQWVDLFKHQGMTMFWAEDYLFSVPEPPQMISWSFGQMRCATKYHGQPIHYYVMPHAPGQEPGFLRRNMVLSVGFGARHIDNFCVAPEERFTENYVAWGRTETFRALSEAIFDAAEAEALQAGGKVRPARVAVVLSKATDYNESRLEVPREQDPFARQCKNAPKTVNQTLCRKDQQLLYLALRHAQHAVDLITEDDIREGALKGFDVVYFAGEWVDRRAVPELEKWVRAGGVLYAGAGLGRLNQYGEPEPSLQKLLGLKDGGPPAKNAYHLRTLLELPLCEPIDRIRLGDDVIEAIALKQKLVPDTAKVLGTWSDGSAAVTVNAAGKGKAFAVGTLPGTAYMKTALRKTPWARGGRHMLYNPTDFAPGATKLARLGVDAKPVERPVVCSADLVEGVVTDHKDGTLLTLVNWTNAPLAKLSVQVKTNGRPARARSVALQRDLAVTEKDGVATFELPALAEADYILLPRR